MIKYRPLPTIQERTDGFFIESLDPSERRESVVTSGKTEKNSVSPFVCIALRENYAVSASKFAHPPLLYVNFPRVVNEKICFVVGTGRSCGNCRGTESDKERRGATYRISCSWSDEIERKGVREREKEKEENCKNRVGGKKFIAARQRARATAGKSGKLLPHAWARDSSRRDKKGGSPASEKKRECNCTCSARQMWPRGRARSGSRSSQVARQVSIL